MKKPLYAFSLLFLLLVSFLGGTWFNQRGTSSNTISTGERQILHYVDPMNPTHTSKEPGIAPCGMPMEPVYADEDVVGGSGTAGAAISASPGTVKVNLQKQQVIGVQIGEVTRTVETHKIRALGRIAADENRIFALIAATDGWMSEVHESTTGSLVNKNQLMAQIKIYDYDFFTWQQRYLTELGNTGRRPVFVTPPAAAVQPRMGMMPTGQQAGSSPPATGEPMTMPSAVNPQETTAGKAPVMKKPPPPSTSSPVTASTGQPHADITPRQGASKIWGIPPGASQYGETMPAAPQPGTLPAAKKSSEKTVNQDPPMTMPMPSPKTAQTGSPHHAEIAPAVTQKISPKAEVNHSKSMAKMEDDEKHGFIREDDILYASKARLELLDLGTGETQLAELANRGVYVTRIDMRSPVDGLVLSRSISPRQKIDRGAECFRIADLSRIWVEADIYDTEAQYIQPGMRALVSLPGQGKYYAARVSKVPPRFDAATRTLKVRLEMNNLEIMFRPDMFVDVEFLIGLPESTTVPSGTVIDSGQRKTVYVVTGEGIFEPREVVTGWQLSDRVEIVEGLKPGEKIVVSGNFLIDSESRMKLAAAGLMTDKAEKPLGGQAPPSSSTPKPQKTLQTMQKEATEPVVKDPVCGMTVDQEQAEAAGLTVELQGKTHFFCSEDCKEQFARDPRRYPDASADIPAPPAPAATEQVDHNTVQASQKEAVASTTKDPVCGMTVDQEQAKAAGLTVELQGKTHYFCSEDCKEQFARDPQRYPETSADIPAQSDAPGQGEHNHD